MLEKIWNHGKHHKHFRIFIWMKVFTDFDYLCCCFLFKKRQKGVKHLERKHETLTKHSSVFSVYEKYWWSFGARLSSVLVYVAAYSFCSFQHHQKTIKAIKHNRMKDHANASGLQLFERSEWYSCDVLCFLLDRFFFKCCYVRSICQNAKKTENT